MAEDLIPLSALVVEGFGGSVHGPATIDRLERQFRARGLQVFVDDIGRRCVTRDLARQLFTERAERQAAAQARAAAVAGEQPDIHAALHAREKRQLELRRQHPELNAYEVMGLDSGQPDGDLDRAARKFDEIMTANRRGLVGFAHRFTAEKG